MFDEDNAGLSRARVLGGGVVPPVCLEKISRQPDAGLENDAECKLSVGVVLLGGLTVPFHGLAMVLIDAQPILIHEPQIELSGRVT